MSKFDEYQSFIAIVDAGSLSKAAQMLHLSPSAVSKKLSLLEDSLGVQLIERSTRSMAVTDLGKAFYRESKAILDSVSQMESRLLDTKEEPIGKLTLSCPRVLLQPFFLNMINRFSEQYPSIKIDLSVSNEVEDLVDGRIDFAFRVGQLKDSRLKAIHLKDTCPVFCAAPGYLQKYGKPNHLMDLEKYKVIVPTYLNLSERMRRLFPGLSLSNQGQLDLDLVHTTDDVYALLQMVLEGGGISMMLDLMVDEHIKNGRLINLFPEMQFPPQQVLLLFTKKDYQPRKMEVFKEYVKNADYFSAT